MASAAMPGAAEARAAGPGAAGPAGSWTALRLLIAVVVLLAPLAACRAASDGSGSDAELEVVAVDPASLDLSVSSSGAGRWRTTGGRRGWTLLPAADGPIAVMRAAVGSSGTMVVGLDGADGSARWATSISADVAMFLLQKQYGLPQHHVEALSLSEVSGSLVVSPDGRYVSIQLGSVGSSEDKQSIPDQRTQFVVLDTSTGTEVRRVEVPGVVLGQALTGAALVVQTAEGFSPKDGGLLRAFSLTDPEAPGTSTPSDLWLVGASSQAVMLGPRERSTCLSLRCAPFTMTLLALDGTARDADGGAVRGTVSGVAAIHRAGWVSAYPDPEAAAATYVEDPNLLKDETIELVEVDSGVRLATGGVEAYEVVLPTGSGLAVRDKRTVGEGEDAQTVWPVIAWVETSSGGGQLRTDDMLLIEHGDGSSYGCELVSEPVG